MYITKSEESLGKRKLTSCLFENTGKRWRECGSKDFGSEADLTET